MNRVTIIEPNKDESCCSCDMSNVRLHRFKNDEPFSDGQEHQHCDLCYETFAGNACQHKKAFDPETAMIMRHVNLVGNILLREIKKLLTKK